MSFNKPLQTCTHICVMNITRCAYNSEVIKTSLWERLCVFLIAQRYQENRAVITTNDDDDVCRHQPITIFDFYFGEIGSGAANNSRISLDLKYHWVSQLKWQISWRQPIEKTVKIQKRNNYKQNNFDLFFLLRCFQQFGPKNKIFHQIANRHSSVYL